MLPTELPRLYCFDASYIYIINLDHEVLTMSDGIHWKLGNIPRQDDLWIRAIKESIYRSKLTISPEVCSEEHMASLALELPKRNPVVGYDFRVVAPETNIREARKLMLTRIVAGMFVKYKEEVTMFGREWSPDSFPFRELTFAVVSIASGQAKFHSFPAQMCSPRSCVRWSCESNHLSDLPGWFNEEWAGDKAPLLNFGSMSHRPGEPPGTSPAETMYWLEDVLISLVLVIDGEAVTNAATWGLEQGRTNFQMVIMSLFTVAFAEVSFSRSMSSPFIKVSKGLGLSPLRPRYCTSTHPRERPEWKDGTVCRAHRGERLMGSGGILTPGGLRHRFPGLAALVNFFDVAASRRAASRSRGIFPAEVYDRIMDFVDYDTWKTCSVVSHELRVSCISKYRLDHRMRIVAGPFKRLREYHRKEPRLSFNFENMETGKTCPMEEYLYSRTPECNWMPVIGRDRRALMVDVFIGFEPAEDVPIEADSHDKES